MKAKILYATTYGVDHPTDPGGEVPVGTIIEGERVFRLVQNGHAAPADEECRLRAGMSDAELKEAQRRYPAIDKGIDAEDREAFFAGEMLGYNPDGSWIPGPNAVEEEEPEEEEEWDYNV